MKRVAIFASGAGSNALNLLATASELKNVQIPLVVVDQQTSPLIEKLAQEYPEVEVAVITPPPMKDQKSRREVHETEILEKLKKHSIDWCFLAGYLRLVGPTLLRAFSESKTHSRILNLHPSLLPKFPGLNAFEQAFNANEKVSGVTIHFVDEGLDTGPILLQRSFEREKKDSLETFIVKGKALEWAIYSEALNLLDRDGTLTPRGKKE